MTGARDTAKVSQHTPGLHLGLERQAASACYEPLAANDAHPVLPNEDQGVVQVDVMGRLAKERGQ